MIENYYYIVVTIDAQKYFINKDMDYTDNFADVLRFCDREEAIDFVKRKRLDKKCAQVIEIVDRR